MIRVFFKRMYWKTYSLPMSRVWMALFLLPLVWGGVYGLASWCDGCARRHASRYAQKSLTSSPVVGWLLYRPVGYVTLFRWLNGLLMICSILVILWVTLIDRSHGHRIFFLVPFHLLFDARHEPALYRSLLMNVFFFLPFGLSVPFGLSERLRHHVLLTLCAAFLLSLSVELLQLFCRVGVFDVDDVMANSLGAWMGSCSWWVGQRLRRLVPDSAGPVFGVEAVVQSGSVIKSSEVGDGAGKSAEKEESSQDVGVN